MVVGEPTLMGGEFGDEDERLITRLENTQYDAANGVDDEEDFNSPPALGNSSPWSSKPPAAQETKSENAPPQAPQWDWPAPAPTVSRPWGTPTLADACLRERKEERNKNFSTQIPVSKPQWSEFEFLSFFSFLNWEDYSSKLTWPFPGGLRR